MRVYGKKIDLADAALKDFFNARAGKYSRDHEYTTILYQDNAPELALQRDKYEKARILPQLDLSPSETVLDIGCGIGRWADEIQDKISHYEGIDFSEALIAIAEKRFDKKPHIHFRHLDAREITPDCFCELAFSRIIISGLFVYLNDTDCAGVLKRILTVSAPDCLIYIREPLAMGQRLTLDNFYSDELKANYNAIYRNVSEFHDLLRSIMMPAGFREQTALTPLYEDDQLSNRAETRQFYTILQRGKA